MEQDRNNWYRLEDLKDWAEGKGKIPMACQSKYHQPHLSVLCYTIEMQTKQNSLTSELLKLTDQSYDQYNVVLEQIMTRLPLDVQVQTFQQVLGEELPLTTARRAYRTAIRIAMGQEDVHREYSPRPVKKKPAKNNSTNTN